MPATQRSQNAAPKPAEVTLIHTQLLRLALGIDDSRAYWANFDSALDPEKRAIQAFEQRWFGAKSLGRVRTLLAYFNTRYGAFPEALGVLRRWRDMEPAARQLICHWHVQLIDPIYRRFTSDFLVQRRLLPSPEFDRNTVVRWVAATYPERWSSATQIQFASKLLSAASEAGLITPQHDPRKLLLPKLQDKAVEYLLYLLRGVAFQGNLVDNPYLASVGLQGPFLVSRLSALPNVRYRKLGDVDEFDWKYPGLSAWAEAVL